jgi:hypothetical protein
MALARFLLFLGRAVWLVAQGERYALVVARIRREGHCHDSGRRVCRLVIPAPGERQLLSRLECGKHAAQVIVTLRPPVVIRAVNVRLDLGLGRPPLPEQVRTRPVGEQSEGGEIEKIAGERQLGVAGRDILDGHVRVLPCIRLNHF